MPTVSSGAGAFGAGLGLAGYDQAEAAEGTGTGSSSAALFFDPYNRVWKQNDDFSMVEGAGPIQRAAVLLLPKGSLPSTSANGLDVVAIRRAAPDQRKRVVEDAVRSALSPVLNAGQLTISKVTLDPSQPWNGKFTVDVVDRITKKPVVLGGNVSGK